MEKKKKFTLWLFMAMAAAVTMAGMNVAVAQEGEDEAFMLQEIVVTAEKRETSLQKTAMAITAVSGADVINRGMVSLDDMMKDLPNVMMSPIGSGSTVAIRGLGMDLPVGVGESAVSTNVDGSFSNSVQMTMFGYFDMDRVEVLRGPQGTLYGRNATGGAVNMVTKNPSTDSINGYLLFELGNYNLHKEEGAINLPLTDKSAMRFAFSNINRDGYMNTGAGDKVGTALRGRYLYEPSEDLSVMLSTAATYIGGISPNTQITLDDYNAGNYYNSTETDPTQRYDHTIYRVNGQVELNAGPGVLTFLPAFERSKDRGYHYNAREEEVLKVNPKDVDQFSGELRYSAPSDADIFWQAGLYYYDRTQEEAPHEDNGYMGITRGAVSKSVFGQVTYPVQDEFRVTLGARFSDEEVNVDDPHASEDLANKADSFGGLDWKLGFEYDLKKDVMAYLTLATSRRPGGYNDFDQMAGVTYDEETLTSYEIGVKSRFLNQRLQLNGSFFYYDYKDYQAVDAWFDADDNEFKVLFFNVPKVKNYGAEFEVEALLGRSTVVGGSVSYLHARYDSTFILHSDPWSPGIDLDGHPLPRSPEWSIKGNIEHTFSLPNGAAIRPSANVRWIDDHYMAPFPGEGQYSKAYTIFDAYLRYVAPGNDWSVNLWGKNLADKVYKTSGSADNVTLGEPRMIGATLNIRF